MLQSNLVYLDLDNPKTHRLGNNVKINLHCQSLPYKIFLLIQKIAVRTPGKKSKRSIRIFSENQVLIEFFVLFTDDFIDFL